MEIDPTELVPNDVAAAELHVRPATLPSWRNQKRGPAYVKIGRAVFYRRSDIRAWLAAQRHEPSAA